MMDLEAEVSRLRSELDQYRQREADDLRRRLSEAVELYEHYKAEAHRNAEVGRQIHLESEKRIAVLEAQLGALQADHARRSRTVR